MKNNIIFEDFLLSTKVGKLDIDENIPFEELKNCPACRTERQVVAELQSRRTSKKIRYGICATCGYMGYIDRPSQDWLANYYSRDWDKLITRSIEEIRSETGLEAKSGPKTSRFIAFSLAQQLPIDKNKSILEIGSGYGEVLKNFKDIGFNSVVGVENSEHRAKIVTEAFDIPVFSGEFENHQVQKNLANFKPFGLIFSHHVLEHTFNPDEIINKISDLQDDGGYLVLALPNAMGEHINYALFYLVHLHSFTKESLEIILNRNGYQIIKDNSPDPTNIILAAQKSTNPKSIFPRRNDYFDCARNRIIRALGMDKIQQGSAYEIKWEQKLDNSDPSQVLKLNFGKVNWWLKKAMSFIKRKLGRYSTVYTFLISVVDSSDSATTGPIRIFFKDKIKLLAK